MKVVNIFVSHSFSDQSYDRGLGEFRRRIHETIESAHGKLGNAYGHLIRPQVFFDSRSYGETLNSTIIQAIGRSEILIADLTGARENVYYELGYAQARGCKLVVIQNEEEDEKRKTALATIENKLATALDDWTRSILTDIITRPALPSDLLGIFVGRYKRSDDIGELIEMRILELLQVIVRGIASGTTGSAPRSFWFHDSVAFITLVCAPEPDDEKGPYGRPGSDNYIYIDNLEDRDAVIEISKYLSRSYPNAEVSARPSNLIGMNLSRANLVIIGGPLNNSLAREFMSRLNVGLDYHLDQGTPVVEKRLRSGKSFCIPVVRDANGLVIQDVGYFLWCVNPLRADTRVVLCQGFQTWGTLVASRVLSDESVGRRNQLHIRKLMDDRGYESFEHLNFVEVFFPVSVTESREADSPLLSTVECVIEIG